jgi:MYXO-CTERM domain-containing protein
MAGAEGVADRLRAEKVWVDPFLDMPIDILADTSMSPILFVNRCFGGCSVSPGPNDARVNTSSIISGTVTLTEFMHDDAVFDETIACLREAFLPYNVDIVTEDPGATPHHEAMLAGNPGEVGYPDNVGGLAPAACSPLNNVISYSFANTIGPSAVDLCWTVAQESAHAFGLPNHVLDCSDPLTYIGGCGQKFFRDKGFQCGDFDPEECRCFGGQEQNSHRTLLEVFGPGPTAPPGPAVIINRPTADETVVPGFDVVSQALDPRGVDRVFLFINGTVYGNRPGHSFGNHTGAYRFIPPELPDGYMTIQIRARNDLRIEGSSSVRVLKGEPCTSDDQCYEDQTCVEGACTYPPADRDFGESCAEAYECTTGLCPQRGDDKFCSEYCNPASAFSCPETFTCLPVGDTGVCWPEDSIGGGCCQVSNDGPLPPAGVVVLAVMVIGFVRRRAR